MPVKRPVHIKPFAARDGLLAVRDELGGELLDPPQSRAFALADHQVAHVYIADRGEIPRVRALLEQLGGIDEIWGEDENARARAGA